MERDAVRGAGRFRVFQRPVGRSGGRGAALLRRIGVAFAKVNTEYFRELTDFPFGYSEKSVRFPLAIAIKNLGALPFGEHPILRRRKHLPRSYGWLDIWVRNNRDTVLLIEHKHTWHSPMRQQVSRRHRRLWSEALTQLDTAAKNLRTLRPDRESVYGVALLTIDVTQWAIKESNLVDVDIKLAEKLARSLAVGLKDRRRKSLPNWIAGWIVHPDDLSTFSEKFGDGRDHYVRSSGVIWLARVDRLV